MTKQTSPGQQQPTDFVGRQSELADLIGLLGDPKCRLITLVGVGGVGKTRLGLRVADEVRSQFADGDCPVSLQPVETRSRMLSTVADALGVSLTGGVSPEEQIIQFLRPREMLLVLDNFEQLRQASDFLALIARQAPHVKLLVTSREALNLREEWLYWLSGLSVPESDVVTGLEVYDSVHLFVERIRQVRPSFSLPNERAGVVRICQLVEGMPLALEMAASWAKTMSCTEIAGEIERSLSFLSSDFRDAAPRHESMQAIFSQTWGRMQPDEQDLCKRLSVFRGGFDRSAAEVVAGATLPLLSLLVDRCLIRRDASGRYQIHELLRQFSAEQLSETEAATAAAAHANYYTQFLAERTAGLAGHTQVATSEEIATELENIRTGWQYAVEHRMTDALVRAATPYYWVCQFRSHFAEYVNAIEPAVAVMEEFGDEADVAQSCVWWGWMLIRIGQFVHAHEVLDRSRVLFEKIMLMPAATVGSHPSAVLIVLHLIHGRYGDAVKMGEELKRKLLANNDTYNLATTCYDLISAYGGLGQVKEAWENAQLATRACDVVGNDYLKAYCLVEWGKIAMEAHRYAEAKSHFRAALEIREQFKDPEGIALALVQLAELARLQNDYVAAREFCERSLSLYRDLNDQGGLAAAQRGLGQIALQRGKYEESAAYFRSALITADAIDFSSLVIAILLDIANLMMANRMLKHGCDILAVVCRHPAATKHQQQVAGEMFDGDCADLGGIEPRDLRTLIIVVRSELQDIAPRAEENRPIAPLTQREHEVLHLMAQGLSNPEIADELVVAVGTVKAHTNSIYGKFQVRNRVAAIEEARALGLLDR